MLTSSSQLGPYEIVSPLGAGGMGEVYRARDTRLDRDVAIKVLPEALARDKERILRFEREAKVLASLNHPNIAAIYGFETISRAAGSTTNLGVAVVELESKKVHEIATRGAYPEFLHDGRRIIFAQDGSRLMLADLEGNPAHVLLDAAPDGIDEAGSSISSDDSAIYYTRVKSESDVWLLQLE